MVTYPEDWKEVQIGDIYQIKRGQVLATNKISSIKNNTNKYPVYSSQTLNNGLLGYYHKFLFTNGITWTTDGANAGTTKYREGQFYCTNVCGVLSSQEGYANACMAEIINKETPKYVSYVGNPKLMSNVVSKISVILPSLQEQQAIASALSDFDEHIDNLSELIEKKKAIRDGALEDLVSGRTRLDGFNGEWIESTIEDSTKEIITGGTPSTTVDIYCWGSIPWLASTEIHQKIITRATKNITNIGLNNSSAKMAPKDSVLIALAGQGKTRGTAAFLAYPMALNQSLAALVAADETDSKFLYYLIENMYLELRELSSGDGGRGGLNKTLIKNINIRLPREIKEQHAIAEVLTSLDDEIESLKIEKEKMLQIKEGAMDDLLTGRVRLKA